ncbi:MAG: DNA polymerase [candidate division KSB1 bacterium]|nr:DNA polymerase [candidate division KSB1 bacterium]MDZ7368057.1 DNA polymerase [candidate division KSB1 bacterium]MDZ7405717.1 DNA polymerase [candidate division KSB1 bacterium]
MSTQPENQGQPLRWLFLDLNSYFASIEQELRPELRGKPVAVVPVMTNSTCCIAASYEAKAFGVKTGTLVGEAKKLCPQIRLIEARHQLYVEYHHAIVQAVESCLPVAVVMSIDEMACRLIGSEQQLEKATRLAKNIKQAIRDKVGKTLRCSIGLAPNRFLAKVASDMQKPDGLVVIEDSDLPQILYSLKLEDFPGVGPAMHKRLLLHGIQTVEQLCALPKAHLRKVWEGIVGERFWHWLRGDDLVEPPTQKGTVGHSHILPPELRTPDNAYAVAQKLVQKAAMRLRKMNYYTGGLQLWLRFVNDRSWSAKTTMVECQDTLTMLEALHVLWQQKPAGKPLGVGVTLFDLVPAHLHNLSLFEDPKRARLMQAMDAINVKFGTDKVYFGGMHHVKHAAPTRIAFTSIPDLF